MAKTVRINCKTLNWKETLRTAIAANQEADLLNFNHSDVAFCMDLAKESGMIFRENPHGQSAHFFRD